MPLCISLWYAPLISLWDKLMPFFAVCPCVLLYGMSLFISLLDELMPLFAVCSCVFLYGMPLLISLCYELMPFFALRPCVFLYGMPLITYSWYALTLFFKIFTYITHSHLAARRACEVPYRSNTADVGSNPTWGMNVDGMFNK
jgi:hypothetical protein